MSSFFTFAQSRIAPRTNERSKAEGRALFFDAETGMGAGEVPLVLFKLHVRCMLFSLDSQAIHLYCNAYFGSRYTRYRSIS